MCNRIFICSLLSILIVGTASAEDMTGVNGANRRVVVSGGYGGVKGTLSEPTSFYLGTNAQINSHKNKPELYMGLSFDVAQGTAVESDAGVTWAQFSQKDSKTGDVYPAQVWWAFTRVSVSGVQSKGYVPLRGSDGKQLRVKKGSLGSFDMACFVEPNGDLNLTVKVGGKSVTGIDPVKWPSSKGQIRSDVIKGMRAKRVIAMTQQGGMHYDNIYLKGVTFEDGQVATLQKKGSQLNLAGWHKWSTVTTKQDYFIPEYRNADSAGKPNGVYVIDLDPPHSRDSNGIPNDKKGLYDEETVNINLLSKPAVVSGKKSKPGGKKR